MKTEYGYRDVAGVDHWQFRSGGRLDRTSAELIVRSVSGASLIARDISETRIVGNA